MSTITAIILRNRRDVHTAEILGMPQFRTRGPKQRPPCWEIDDNMAMLDTALRGFHCGPIYIIADHDANIDDVFDGAHRCEAIFSFIDNKYPVTKGKKDTIKWENSPLLPFVGKYFRDLPPVIQQKLKDYKFYINVIDAETANDPSALGMLWERLSKAGKPLNKFETNIQTLALLQKDILEPSGKSWLESPFFPAAVSKRGQVEMKLMRLLALSEKDTLPTYGSMDDLVEKWHTEVLGTTTEMIDANTQEKKELLLSRLRCMRNLLKELQDRNILHEDGKCIIDKGKEMQLLIVLGRLANWFTMSMFRRVAEELCPKLLEILKMNPNDLCKFLNVTSRNATFQKKLVEHVDITMKPYSDKTDRRCFTAVEKAKKLEEQGGLCAECKKTILEHQRNAGDHIVEFCLGGPTTYDNLRILHKICHEKKNMTKA